MKTGSERDLEWVTHRVEANSDSLPSTIGA